MSKKYKQAFSLVEISIVILVVGILISGVSKGIDLYESYNLEVAKNLTRNSIVGRLENVRLWYETTLDDSFVNKENKDGNPITIWQDIKKNSHQNLKYHAYGAQRTDSSLVNYEVNNINKVSGPKYKLDGINNLPTLNFKNEYSSSISQFMVIDHNLKFDHDDFNIFMVIEVNDIPTAINNRLFLIDTCASSISLCANPAAHNQLIFYLIPDGGNWGTVKNGSFTYIDFNNLIKIKRKYLINLERKFNSTYKTYINTKLKKTWYESHGEIDFRPIKIGRHATRNFELGSTYTSVDGDINMSEFIITNGPITDFQKKQIEEYLVKKYNLSNN